MVGDIGWANIAAEVAAIDFRHLALTTDHAALEFGGHRLPQLVQQHERTRLFDLHDGTFATLFQWSAPEDSSRAGPQQIEAETHRWNRANNINPKYRISDH